ncbi:SDR family NAD(P)-dependent oxidoreductase [Aestuariivirga sp.]|uniref:SDR family NAD(P)-dependent oxidoreductase n=1 Tax=Aestuariivirga sp. TaxID=2650926 RepID=UPI003BAB0E67
MKIVILGATSSIAAATSRLYAKDGDTILLAGRNERRLQETAADLLAHGASRVEVAVTDLSDPANAQARLAGFGEMIGGIDHVLLAYGSLGDQAEASQDEEAAADILRINFTSAAAWALGAANLLEQQGRGSLVVFGSVAGDRGRRNNFVYGAAKAGLAALTEGISHRFANRGPRAVLIKIGPTITPMTAHMNRQGLLWAKPEHVAKIIHARAASGGTLAYAPGYWRFIMAIIRSLPNAVFNRLDI